MKGFQYYYFSLLLLLLLLLLFLSICVSIDHTLRKKTKKNLIISRWKTAYVLSSGLNLSGMVIIVGSVTNLDKQRSREKIKLTWKNLFLRLKVLAFISSASWEIKTWKMVTHFCDKITFVADNDSMIIPLYLAILVLAIAVDW